MDNLDLTLKQLELEKLYGKNQQFDKLLEIFKETVLEIIPEEEEYKEFSKLLAKFLTALYITKVVSVTESIKLLGLKDLQQTATVVEFAIENDLVDIERGYIKNIYKIPAEVEKEIEKYQFPLPMLVQPEDVDYHKSGYLAELKNMPLVTKAQDIKELDLRFDHINRMNSVELVLNTAIANKFQFLEPKLQQGQSIIEWKKDVAAYQKYIRNYGVIENTFADTSMYLTHFYDKRGRTYCRGYFVNTQGDDIRKASVSINQFEKITNESLKWVKISVANSYGNDKVSWDDRVNWFDSHENDLESLLSTADKPAQTYSGILAYYDFIQGKPNNHLVSLDATASCLQIMAVLFGCKQTALITNVIGNTRNDPYTIIHNATGLPTVTRKEAKEAIMQYAYCGMVRVNEVYGDKVDTFIQTMQQEAPCSVAYVNSIKTFWDGTALNHSWIMPDGFDVVVPVMDTEKEFVTLFEKPVEVSFKVNKPKKFGLSIGANFIHSVDAMIVREMVARCYYDPDKIKDILENMDKPNSIEPSDMSARLATCVEMSRYVPASLLDLPLTDYYHLFSEIKEKLKELINSLPEKPFVVLNNHDCFKCLPAYCDDMRKQYKLIMRNLLCSDTFAFMLSTLTNENVDFTKDESWADEILTSEYAIC